MVSPFRFLGWNTLIYGSLSGAVSYFTVSLLLSYFSLNVGFLISPLTGFFAYLIYALIAFKFRVGLYPAALFTVIFVFASYFFGSYFGENFGIYALAGAFTAVLNGLIFGFRSARELNSMFGGK